MSRLDRIQDWAKLAELAAYDCSKLAKLCMVSQTHLRRYFCSRFHKPPQKLLTELRLWNAAHILRSSHSSVKDIARELGFADESQLCHQFKAYFGCTPDKYALVCLGSNGSPLDNLRNFPRFLMQRDVEGAPIWNTPASTESLCQQKPEF
jgi:AraC-like DNA-binding protein